MFFYSNLLVGLVGRAGRRGLSRVQQRIDFFDEYGW